MKVLEILLLSIHVLAVLSEVLRYKYKYISLTDKGFKYRIGASTNVLHPMTAGIEWEFIMSDLTVVINIIIIIIIIIKYIAYLVCWPHLTLKINAKFYE